MGKPDREFNVLGTRVPRKDALEKVTGSAKYAADYSMPGMLWSCTVTRRTTNCSTRRGLRKPISFLR